MLFSRGLARAALVMTAIICAAFPVKVWAVEPVPAQGNAVPTQPVEMLVEKPVIKKFGSWSTRCEQFPTKPKTQRCHAFVDVRIGERRERILYLGVNYTPTSPSSPFVFAVTPLGTVLPGGITLTIDNTTKLVAPYVFCAPAGCQSELVLTSEQIESLRTGKQVEIMFRLVDQGEVKVPSDLDGFKAAFDSIPKPKPVARP